MEDLAGKRVLITGGASGIGKIMARLMLDRKAKVVIWDINNDLMNTTLAEYQTRGSIVGYQVDVSDISQIESFATKLKLDQGKVDIIINNAGIIVGKYFHAHTVGDITKTMQINAIAPMIITREFLPDMLADGIGHICNIASSGGLVSNPKMSAYVASKWSLIGWSDSLRLEMQQNKTNIHVTTIMPYYIKTGMFDGVKSRIPLLEPEAAALTIVKAIEKNKIMLSIPSYMYRFSRFGQAFMSIKFFDWFAGSLLGVYKTMDHFKGRKS